MEKTYKLVPPDGGYGYVVAIAAIINLTVVTAFAGCFGMLYNDFLTEKALGSAGMTTLGGVFTMSAALTAFFTSPLLKILSLRKVASMVAVITSCGTLGTAVMTSPLTFFIFAGIMQGIGLGGLHNLTCTIINYYFFEKRLLMMSFVQTATGILSMVTPMFLKWSLDQYGSRGTLLITGGISMNSIVAALMMQPVKWHMKKIHVIETTEKELLLLENTDLNKIPTILKLTNIEVTDTKEDIEKVLDLPKNNEKKSGVRKVLESLLDTSLLKTFLRSCTSFGPAVSLSVDGIFTVILPQYLYSMQWTQEKVAMALALYGFGDLAMRAIFTGLSKWIFKLGIQRLYIAGVIIAALSRLGMLWSGSVTATMVFLTLAGSSHCSITVLSPLVISEAVAPNKFTSALGTSMLINGILSITLGPVIGALRDWTNSFSVAFYILMSFFTLIAVLWSVELILKGKKQRRKFDKMNSNSSQLIKVPL